MEILEHEEIGQMESQNLDESKESKELKEITNSDYVQIIKDYVSKNTSDGYKIISSHFRNNENDEKIKNFLKDRDTFCEPNGNYYFCKAWFIYTDLITFESWDQYDRELTCSIGHGIKSGNIDALCLSQIRKFNQKKQNCIQILFDSKFEHHPLVLYTIGLYYFTMNKYNESIIYFTKSKNLGCIAAALKLEEIILITSNNIEKNFQSLCPLLNYLTKIKNHYAFTVLGQFYKYPYKIYKISNSDKKQHKQDKKKKKELSDADDSDIREHKILKYLNISKIFFNLAIENGSIESIYYIEEIKIILGQFDVKNTKLTKLLKNGDARTYLIFGLYYFLNKQYDNAEYYFSTARTKHLDIPYYYFAHINSMKQKEESLMEQCRKMFLNHETIRKEFISDKFFINIINNFELSIAYDNYEFKSQSFIELINFLKKYSDLDDIKDKIFEICLNVLRDHDFKMEYHFFALQQIALIKNYHVHTDKFFKFLNQQGVLLNHIDRNALVKYDKIKSDKMTK